MFLKAGGEWRVEPFEAPQERSRVGFRLRVKLRRTGRRISRDTMAFKPVRASLGASKALG